jgi:hypothetical protein
MTTAIHMRFPDFCDEATALEILEDFREVILSRSEPVYLIVEIGNFMATRLMLKEARQFMREISSSVLATGIVGMYGFRDIVFQSVKLFAQKEMRSFRTVNDAIAWFEQNGSEVVATRPNEHTIHNENMASRRYRWFLPPIIAVGIISVLSALSLMLPSIYLYVTSEPGFSGVYIETDRPIEIGGYALINSETIPLRYRRDQIRYLIKQVVATDGTIEKGSGVVIYNDEAIKTYTFPELEVWQGNITDGVYLLNTDSSAYDSVFHGPYYDGEYRSVRKLLRLSNG